jgi:hypothetical protein
MLIALCLAQSATRNFIPRKLHGYEAIHENYSNGTDHFGHLIHLSNVTGDHSLVGLVS